MWYSMYQKKKSLPTCVWQLFCQWWVIECRPAQGHSRGPVELARHDSFLRSPGEAASVSSSYCCKPEACDQQVHCTKYWSLTIDPPLKRRRVFLSLACFLSLSPSVSFSINTPTQGGMSGRKYSKWVLSNNSRWGHHWTLGAGWRTVRLIPNNVNLASSSSRSTLLFNCI